MKALILAAGFGTRLLPHTRVLPKPLFPIGGRPAIDILIRQLAVQGYNDIIINTHHLHGHIENFIRRQHYPVAVTTRFEPEILGTGGAIRNVADFMGNHSFLVINSDIFTDIDVGAVIRFHRAHPHPVTMVMHDHPEFNTVRVDDQDHVTGLDPAVAPAADATGCRLLAFTGIQVLDTEVFDFIPAQGFVSSIDVYREMITRGRILQACIVNNHRWHDIGSPAGYADAVMDAAAPAAFSKAFGREPEMPVTRTRLAGDGSDRKWFRLSSGYRSLIAADHGIRTPGEPLTYPASEAAAFVSIGNHLFEKGIAVPRIYNHDEFSGLVFVADLGDENLQARVVRAADEQEIIDCYRSVIDALIHMSVRGSEGFDSAAWTCQTPAYDRQLILERECRYFVEAFLNGYLGMDIDYNTLAPEFEKLADLATVDAVIGFMHRDLQSKNIMIMDERPFFIDFQGGRLGPIQYDLASLLCDPYVDLSENTRSILLGYCMEKLEQVRPINRESFIAGCHFCSITRLLQALGAFGYLTRVKAKPGFAPYMPVALKTLHNRLDSDAQNLFKQLRDTVVSARKHFKI